MTEQHSCEQKGCKGERFGGLHVFCMKCEQEIFVGCMIGTYAKMVLENFDVIYQKEDKSGHKITNDALKLTNLTKFFAIDSPFAVTCRVCDAKKKVNDANMKAKLTKLIGSRIIDTIENELKSIIEGNEFEDDNQTPILIRSTQEKNENRNTNDITKQTEQNDNSTNTEKNKMSYIRKMNFSAL